MLLALTAGMVPFGLVRLSCGVIYAVPDCSECKETNLDWHNTDSSDTYPKMYQKTGPGPLISAIMWLPYSLF